MLMAGKDSRVTGGIFQDFCTSNNVILQTAIPGHRQSSAATERRRGLLRTITDHDIGERKPKNLNNKEWGEFAARTMMRLNSQVQQYDGFTPGQRFLGRTPKLPIGAVGNPFSKILRTRRKNPTQKRIVPFRRCLKFDKHR